MHDDGYFDERVAAKYDEDVSELFDPDDLEPLIDFLAELAGSGRALELGIGTGRIALPLAQRGVEVHGIDLSESMVAKLRAKPGGENIGVTIGDFATTKVDGSFALAYVVLSVATTVHHPDNSFYGLAIGFTVMAGAITMGGVSGGAFNPAVAVGISIAGLVTWAMLPIYFVATLVGGGLAAVAFRALNPNHAASSDTPDGPPEAADRQSANGARRTGAGRVKV